MITIVLISASSTVLKAASDSSVITTGICNDVCTAATKAITLVTYSFLGNITTTITKTINFSHSVTNGIMPQNATITVGESMILTENSTSGTWFVSGGIDDSPVADGLLHWYGGNTANHRVYHGVSTPVDRVFVNIVSDKPGVLECHPTWGCTARSPGYATVSVQSPDAARSVDGKLIGDNWGFGVIRILSEAYNLLGSSPCPRCALVYTWTLQSVNQVTRVYSIPTIYYGISVAAKPNAVQTVNCEYPTNVTTNSATFNWIYQDPEGDYPTNYHAQVATDPGFTNIVWQAAQSSGSGGTNTTWGGNVNIPAGTLTQGTQYYSRIAVHNNINSWGNGFQIGPNCGSGFRLLPPPPTNLTAVCSANGGKVTISWTNPPGYTNIYFRAYDNTVDQYLNSNDNYQGSSITFSNVTPGNSYRVWIHTKDLNISSGRDYSEVIETNFKCNSIPPPTNLSGACSADGKTADMSWVNATGYDFVNFSIYDKTLYPQATPETIGTNATYTNKIKTPNYVSNHPTLPDHTYVWWVETLDTVTGNWSKYVKNEFTCNSIPPPTNLSGACSADGRNATMSWTRASGYDTVNFRAYDKTLYPNSTPTTIGNSALWVNGLKVITYSMPTLAGHTYSWWVETLNTVTNEWGNYVLRDFTCPPPPNPTNLTTTCSADLKSATISWTSPTGYPNVYFIAYNNTTKQNLNWDENYNQSSITIPVTPGQDYSIWVHAKDSTVNSFGSSGVGTNFKCSTPKPINASGSCTIDGGRANFSWEKPADYNNFLFRAVDKTLHPDSYVLDQTYRETGWNDNIVGSTNSFTTTPGHQYLWWMRTRDAADININSDVVSGSFQCPLPGQGVCSAIKNTCLSSLLSPVETQSENPYTYFWTCPSVSPIIDTYCGLNKNIGPTTPGTPTTIKIRKSPAITLNKGGYCTISWIVSNPTEKLNCSIKNSSNIIPTLINGFTSSKVFGPLYSNTKYTITCLDTTAKPPVNVSASTICRVNPTSGEI